MKWPLGEQMWGEEAFKGRVYGKEAFKEEISEEAFKGADVG